jgi:hypothetical protein
MAVVFGHNPVSDKHCFVFRVLEDRLRVPETDSAEQSHERSKQLGPEVSAGKNVPNPRNGVDDSSDSGEVGRQRTVKGAFQSEVVGEIGPLTPVHSYQPQHCHALSEGIDAAALNRKRAPAETGLFQLQGVLTGRRNHNHFVPLRANSTQERQAKMVQKPATICEEENLQCIT